MKRKEVVICILTIVMLMFSMTNVFATITSNQPPVTIDGDGEDDNSSIVGPTIDDDDDEDDNGIIGGGTLIKDGEIPANNNSNAVNNQMPNTGLEDIPVVAIGICIVATALGLIQIKRYSN